MLLFSTVLDIRHTMKKEDFINLVIEWNQSSTYESNIIPNLEWHNEYSIRYGTDKLWLAIEEYEDIVAVRFEKQEEDGTVWDTDYVMNFAERKMSIRLDRSYTEEAWLQDTRFSTPHFITLLIEHNYLKDDEDLPVLREPIFINERNIYLVSQVINGMKWYKLPVVYISKTGLNEDPVDIYRLAGRLKGVAHVFVQESGYTNSLLRNLCDGQNEYNGAIGIYYPNASLEAGRYLYYAQEGQDPALMEKVIRSVILYCNAQMVQPLYTWQGVNNALLRKRLEVQMQEQAKTQDALSRLVNSIHEEGERIRKEALEDAEQLLESFDEENARLQKQIEELTQANETLQFENQSLKSKVDASDTDSFLHKGKEREFYPGEKQGLILSALEDALPYIQGNRRKDVVKDVIESNPNRIIDDKIKEVKRLLKDYTKMTPKLKQALYDLGFTMTEDGKHIKLIYYKDQRYQIMFAKTPSDVRSGKNNASEIIKQVY